MYAEPFGANRSLMTCVCNRWLTLSVLLGGIRQHIQRFDLFGGA
jgi:hypothetical protein